MIIYHDKDITQKTILKAINDKIQENARLIKMQNYYKGKQSISERFYEDETKPNNRICINYCKEIADFFTNYLVGVPLVYENMPPKIIDTLKYNDDDEVLLQAVKQMNINGFSCELFYTDEQGNVRYASLNPLECIIFCQDDLQGDIKAFIRLIKNDEETGGYTAIYYTDTYYQSFMVDDVTSQLSPISDEVHHFFNDVPINLYKNNDELQGTFEQIISLQDGLNKLMSDNINEIEQFADSYLVLKGLNATKNEDISEMKRNRVLLLDSDSGAEWLTKSVNTQHVKQLQDDLKYFIKQNSFLPDFDVLGNGIVLQSGEALKTKLILTEIQANGQQRAITKAIQRKFELLYNIYSLSEKLGDYTDITFKFERVILPDIKVYSLPDADDEFTP